MSNETPLSWYWEHFVGTRVPTGARLMAAYLAGWSAGLIGCWPPEPFPTEAMIAVELGITARTARRYLKLLEDSGFMDELRRRQEGSRP
jgi:hypothetical protein